MNDSSNIPVPNDYRDRRLGLVAFGVLEIFLGLLCLLAILGIFLAKLLTPRLGAVITPQLLRSATAIYGLLALALIWLGVGSILCKRWARVLTLIGAWSVLLMGIVFLISYGIFGKEILGDMQPDMTTIIALILSIVFQSIFLVVLPGIMVIFYGNRNVIATCEARDPRVRWTDRCPMPVLATSLWLAIGSLSLLMLPLCYRSVVPWFGTYASGVPATIILVISVLLGLYVAWGTYRLQLAAWWCCNVFVAILSVSAIVTFQKSGFIEFYRQMGYPSEQIELMQNHSFLSSSVMVWGVVIFYILFLIFQLRIRKYFRGNGVG
jgi:hypothetical protein